MCDIYSKLHAYCITIIALAESEQAVLTESRLFNVERCLRVPMKILTSEITSESILRSMAL